MSKDKRFSLCGVEGVTTTYYLDGAKLLGEDRSDGKKLRYFYDLQGVCGFSYTNGSETKKYFMST